MRRCSLPSRGRTSLLFSRHDRTPYADQRKTHILDRLLTDGRVDAVEVAESLGVTDETIRKDLIALERHGLLRRVHGGAVPVQSLAFEPAVETRTELASEKTRIAQAALNHLPAEGSVLIDAGPRRPNWSSCSPATGT